MSKVVLFFVLSVVLISCTQVTFNDTLGSKVVASVGDDKLYLRDVAGLNAPNLTAEDTLAIIKNYADFWIRKRVVDNYSQEKYEDRTEEVEKLLEEYKRSLFTEFLEKEYTKGVSDKVSDKEITSYYNINKKKLILAAPIVKAHVLVMPSKYKDAKRVEKKIESKSRQDFDDILSIAERDKLLAKDFSQSWFYFSDVVRYIPFSGDITSFLKSEKSFDVTVQDNKYILSVVDYKLKGDIMPFELVTDMIRRSIILERQKSRIEQVKDSIYNDALLNGVAVMKMNLN